MSLGDDVGRKIEGISSQDNRRHRIPLALDRTSLFLTLSLLIACHKVCNWTLLILKRFNRHRRPCPISSCFEIRRPSTGTYVHMYPDLPPARCCVTWETAQQKARSSLSQSLHPRAGHKNTALTNSCVIQPSHEDRQLWRFRQPYMANCVPGALVSCRNTRILQPYRLCFRLGY